MNDLINGAINWDCWGHKASEPDRAVKCLIDQHKAQLSIHEFVAQKSEEKNRSGNDIPCIGRSKS